ncbi:splicing factor, suppressor of white-apricot homolog isoform X2 [Watersipora subatra]|uniref:splicing factor, suppressor of white-apricot homolog isoform X2 n=2 Tax=Watersipora subatra TaxID=2589382 RepID=UPI00355C6B9F
MSFLLPQNESTLRNNETIGSEKHQDLLVFGYQCKLFHDDVKAIAIDSGEHLIPWMGDSSLKIDRYDGRGHLFDLRPYDADNPEHRGELTSDEKRIERLCEEERYLELHTDIAERAIQEEEEIKRLNMELASSSGYQAVAFSYDQPAASTSTTEQSHENEGAAAEANEEEEDYEFVPPQELCLPKSMEYPSGTKLNALIEKTAKFVSAHGGQMEIMIKTKQANNPQFKFLNFEHKLNPYYKHQVYMMKSGRYNPDIHNKPTNSKSADVADSSDEDEGDNSGYLHPSLLAAKATSGQSVDAVNTVPQYTQSQLENTTYGRLLKKISDNLPVVTNSPRRTATPTYRDTDSPSMDITDQTGDSGHPSIDGYNATAIGLEDYSYDQACYSQYYQDSTGVSDLLPFARERPVSPPADVKPLIERLIGYIKKDGEAFEKQVLLKNDERFSFLHAEDAWHDYYKWRKECLLQEQNSGESGKSKGVSFSIKQRESEVSGINTNRAALPIDPESDEETVNSETTNSLRTPTVRGISPSQYIPNAPLVETLRTEEKPPPSEESLQKKIAEQKLRDKLAAAAREKMTQVTQNTKEKSLQAERKKKAAMFVNMLRSKQKSVSELPPPIIGPELPPGRIPSPGTSAIESRLAEDPDVEYVSSSRIHIKGRSPPSAYAGKTHRRDRASNRSESREHRHRRDKNSHHRKRRTPSPPLKKQKSSASREPSGGLPPPHKSSRPNKQTDSCTTSNTLRSTSPASAPSASLPKKDDNDFMLKVRKMLRESRKTAYKEDIFGS